MAEGGAPRLQPGKEFHFFMSYCNENKEDAHIIVKHLEREGFRVSFHERDFLPGERILENTNANMSKSMSMVVVLSKDFNKSRFCRHELEQAVHMQVEDGYSVIPVKIETCDLPLSIKDKTYIDAENGDLNHIPERIIDVLLDKERHSAENRSENGHTWKFKLNKTRSWRHGLLPTRFSFSLDNEAKQILWENNLQVSEKQLDDIECTINSSILVKYQHVYDSFGCIFVLLFVLFCLIVAILLTTICLTVYGPTVGDGVHGDKALLITGTTCPFVGLIICLYAMFRDRTKCDLFSRRIGRITENQQYQANGRIRRRLWIINQHYNDLKLLVIFDIFTLTLIVMRYDFGPCKRIFKSRCGLIPELCSGKANDESLEEYTERTFNNFLKSGRIYTLKYPAKSTRHRMVNGASCVCYQLEQGL